MGWDLFVGLEGFDWVVFSFEFELSKFLLSIRGFASFENESWVAFSSFEMLFMFSPYSPTFFIMAICRSLIVSSIWVSRFSISMV